MFVSKNLFLFTFWIQFKKLNQFKWSRDVSNNNNAEVFESNIDFFTICIFIISNCYLYVGWLYFISFIDSKVTAPTSFVINNIRFPDRLVLLNYYPLIVWDVVKLDHCLNVILLLWTTDYLLVGNPYIFVNIFEKCESTHNFITPISKYSLYSS